MAQPAFSATEAALENQPIGRLQIRVAVLCKAARRSIGGATPTFFPAECANYFIAAGYAPE